jgi:hypothetical protein
LTAFTISSLKDLGCEAIALGALYSVKKKGELFYDGFFFTLLRERHGKFVRQWKLPVLMNQKRAVRIDFKERHKNGAVLEFACRAKAGTELGGAQNRSEIRKLLRASAARTRVLVLLDPSSRAPLLRTKVANEYRALALGKGRRNRLAIRVIYVPRALFRLRLALSCARHNPELLPTRFGHSAGGGLLGICEVAS